MRSLQIKKGADLDVAFGVSLLFGESWVSKKDRIQRESRYGGLPGWDLVSLIVKSNDDLRQEVLCMQLIELCQHVFMEAGLDLWLRPYQIISTGATTGIVETLTDAISLDALKKQENFVSLASYFQRTYGVDKDKMEEAKKAFVASMGAYSVSTL